VWVVDHAGRRVPCETHRAIKNSRCCAFLFSVDFVRPVSYTSGMIARITGRLDEVGATSVLIDAGDGLAYEVLVPSCDVGRYASRMGQPLTLYTLHVIDGDPSRGGAMTPRLIGFMTEADRDFFKIYTTCKGIGMRKALKSLAQPIPQVAAAIENKDDTFLKALPEIGKRTAETMIATLHGRLGEFADSALSGSEVPQLSEAGAEALAVLVQLGERRGDAEMWISRVLAVAPELTTAEEIIQHVYRIKAGG
jgi:Holliday junction DNA helicase RuvA